MDILSEDFCAWLGDARRDLERDLERRQEALENQQRTLMALQKVEEIASENQSLQQQLAEEKQQRAELEMKMNEMSKLSAGMAKKASQNDLEKALRIFLNTSRRKTMSKREAAKTVIMELLSSAKIDISDDVLELLNHLDDEQAEPKIVNVSGNYNDVHDNGEVKLKV